MGPTTAPAIQAFEPDSGSDVCTGPAGAVLGMPGREFARIVSANALAHRKASCLLGDVFTSSVADAGMLR